VKIASVTLSGSCQDIIGDAIKSVVDFVDICILVDTGIKDDTIETARAFAQDKLVVKSWPWRNDFAAARNYTLQAAAEEGADWALILDTDERINIKDPDIQDKLANPDIGAYLVNDQSLTYSKTRFIRVPSKARFYGPTHEVFPSHEVGCETLDASTFWELPKTFDQAQHKFQRDLDILLKHTAKNPKDPRWFYYLGDTYKNLGRLKEAINAYNRCWSLNGWDEESAWCQYRAAECHISLKEYRQATEACTKGMLRHPGIAELPWLAGWCSFQIGDVKKALYWSMMAASLGYPEGVQDIVGRIGFKHPPALWEGPFDVLRACYKVLSNNDPSNLALKDKLDLYETKFQDYYKRRLSGI